MLGNFLIGLREGLEASLIVSILIAYLVKSDRRDKLPVIWVGVALALVVSLGAGLALYLAVNSGTTFKTQETMGGLLSLVAAAFVTTMIFWMRRTARRMRAELEGKVDTALSLGSAALGVMAFITVGREGLETAIIIYSTSQSISGPTPFIGTMIGLAVAVVLGYLMYLGAIRINLTKFFKYTGIGLIVVAAGVFAYGWNDLQEAGILPGISDLAFDISGQWWLQGQAGSAVNSLLKGAFNFTPTPTKLMFTMWLVYLVPVMTLFVWPQRRPVKPASTSSRVPVHSG